MFPAKEQSCNGPGSSLGVETIHLKLVFKIKSTLKVLLNRLNGWPCELFSKVKIQIMTVRLLNFRSKAIWSK